MAGKNISSVDEKGRVLIPQSLRDAANLKPGEKVVLKFDGKMRAIVVEPAYEKKLLKLQILLS
ncbi:MAG: AbrB/MazE/SpoVT family DNA-binding domain-containing protein, partial [Candidatus Anstonellaceae archaeon]